MPIATTMKCGNRDCDYELFLQELGFVICPKCGGTIEANLRPEYFKKLYLTGQTDRFKQDVRLMETVERVLRLSPIVLLIIAEFSIWGLGGTVLDKEWPWIFIWADTQFSREVRVVLGISSICFVLNKAYDYLRVSIEPRYWYWNNIPHLLIKGLFYIGIVLFIIHVEWPAYYDYLITTPKVTRFTQLDIDRGLANAITWYLGLVLWNLVVNYVAEWIDLTNERRVYAINQAILMRPFP